MQGSEHPMSTTQRSITDNDIATEKIEFPSVKYIDENAKSSQVAESELVDTAPGVIAPLTSPLANPVFQNFRGNSVKGGVRVYLNKFKQKKSKLPNKTQANIEDKKAKIQALQASRVQNVSSDFDRSPKSQIEKIQRYKQHFSPTFSSNSIQKYLKAMNDLDSKIDTDLNSDLQQLI